MVVFVFFCQMKLNVFVLFSFGAGAFLVPYFITAVFAGLPMFFMECSLGQFVGSSGLRAWNIVPILKGPSLSLSFSRFHNGATLIGRLIRTQASAFLPSSTASGCTSTTSSFWPGSSSTCSSLWPEVGRRSGTKLRFPLSITTAFQNYGTDFPLIFKKEVRLLLAGDDVILVLLPFHFPLIFEKKKKVRLLLVDDDVILVLLPFAFPRGSVGHVRPLVEHGNLATAIGRR